MVSLVEIAKQRQLLDAYQHRPLPIAPPIVEMTFRDHPITLETLLHRDAKRISIWMPGQQGRGEPLLSQDFGYEEYHELASEAARQSNSYLRYGDGAVMGPTDGFAFTWAEKNYRKILEARDKREREGMIPLWDPFALPSDPVDVEEIELPDGRRGMRLKPNKNAEQRRLASEMEELPGFGSF